MGFRRSAAIFDPRMSGLLRDHPIVIADVGARGEVFEPWGTVRAILDEGSLSIIGFEPDAAEAERIDRSSSPSVRCLPYALWSGEGDVPLYLGADPSTSSVHPPDFDVLAQFAIEHEAPRRSERRLSVPAVPLDHVAEMENLDIDFLKIDSQGSEWEILQGARETLRKSVVALIAETWTVPVHRGQTLMHEVAGLIWDEGFEIVDLHTGGRWRRRLLEGRGVAFSRPEVVGVDLLCLRRENDVRAWLPERPGKVLTAALIADLYGFSDRALRLLAIDGVPTPHADDFRLTAEVIRQRRAGRRRVRNQELRDLAARFSRRFLGRDWADYPPIH